MGGEGRRRSRKGNCNQDVLCEKKNLFSIKRKYYECVGVCDRHTEGDTHIHTTLIVFRHWNLGILIRHYH